MIDDGVSLRGQSGHSMATPRAASSRQQLGGSSGHVSQPCMRSPPSRSDWPDAPRLGLEALGCIQRRVHLENRAFREMEESCTDDLCPRSAPHNEGATVP